MIIYFIKAILCAFFFLFIYMILFERENMHRFKRHYLLCGLVLSFVIPLVALDIAAPQLNEEINKLYTESKMDEHIALLINRIYPESNMAGLTPEPATLPTEKPAESFASSVLFADYVFMAKLLYIIVSFTLLLRLSRNLFRLLYVAKRGKRIILNNKKIILIKENLVPFSFGTCIYINEDDYKNGLIAEDMIMHEQAHTEQRHSLDVIFIELLITILWFNPALYLYRRKIKQNHEFLADEAVLKANNNVTRYQNILISIISKNGSTGLASSLNYSTIKKRFIMMKKETSQRKARYKKVMLIPAMLLATCMFSTHTIANKPAVILTESIDENKAQEEEFIIPGKGVSDELLKEYQSIVEKYLIEDNGKEVKWKEGPLSNADRNRMYTIYVQMTREQQNKQNISLLGPFFSRKCRPMNKQEWDVTKNAEKIWFNGKMINASELDKYTRNDIYYYYINYRKEMKNTYQSALWTKEGYDTYIEQYREKIPLSVLLEIIPSVESTVSRNNIDGLHIIGTKSWD
jgi:Antirepressor regulating drug resistance, predicted signal transduction N-terminal membrane component